MKNGYLYAGNQPGMKKGDWVNLCKLKRNPSSFMSTQRRDFSTLNRVQPNLNCGCGRKREVGGKLRMGLLWWGR